MAGIRATKSQQFFDSNTHNLSLFPSCLQITLTLYGLRGMPRRAPKISSTSAVHLMHRQQREQRRANPSFDSQDPGVLVPGPRNSPCAGRD